MPRAAPKVASPAPIAARGYRLTIETLLSGSVLGVDHATHEEHRQQSEDECLNDTNQKLEHAHEEPRRDGGYPGDQRLRRDRDREEGAEHEVAGDHVDAESHGEDSVLDEVAEELEREQHRLEDPGQPRRDEGLEVA